MTSWRGMQPPYAKAILTPDTAARTKQDYTQVSPMSDLILASASAVRRELLQQAGISVDVRPARVDEAALRDAMIHDGARPRDVADALAEMKARKVASVFSTARVVGCDQILALGDQIFSKPQDVDDARLQLRKLRGRAHHLYSAVVLYDQGQPVWRHISTARLVMRDVSDTYLEAYLGRNWPAVAQSVGGYMLEAEGVRLFTEIEGDYFSVLGLPLLPLISYLSQRGFIAS